MMKITGLNWTGSFTKTCIVVKGKYPHVRDYKRPVEHGMNRMEAEWKAHYSKTPIEFKEF